MLFDNAKRKYFLKFEIKYQIFNIFFKNSFTPNLIKYRIAFKKSRKKRRSSLIQKNNRCFILGRNRYVNKKTRQSRFTFRIESYAGQMPGFKRAS